MKCEFKIGYYYEACSSGYAVIYLDVALVGVRHLRDVNLLEIARKGTLCSLYSLSCEEFDKLLLRTNQLLVDDSLDYTQSFLFVCHRLICLCKTKVRNFL